MNVQDWVGLIASSTLVATALSGLFNRRLVIAQTRQLEADAEHQRAQTEELRRQGETTKRRTDTQADQLATLRLIVAHLVSTHEQQFLRRLANDSTYVFEDNFREKDHLRRLCDLELIKRTGEKSIADMRAGDQLIKIVTLAPPGAEYLKVLDGLTKSS